MRQILLFLLLAACATAATYNCATVGTSPTNWSNASNWANCNGTYPNNAGGNLYTATINTAQAVTIDVPVTVGASSVEAATGAGTISVSGSNPYVVVGAGTNFTTALRPGCFVQASGIMPWNGNEVEVNTITDDTHFTVPNSGAVTAVAYTYSCPAIYVGSQSASLTVASGVALTVKGDFVWGGPLTLQAGSGLVVDGSVAGQNYRLEPGGFYVASTITALGTSGSHVSISSASAAYPAFFTDFGLGSGFVFLYTDFSTIGSTSIPSFYNAAPQGTRQERFDHCTFTTVGQITFGQSTGSATADIIFTDNRVLAGLPGVGQPWDFLQLAMNQHTTGQRLISGNVFATPDQDTGVLLLGDHDYTVTNNVFSRVSTGNSGAPFAAFDGDLFYARTLGAGTVGWSFIGNGGDSLTNIYFLQDEGEGQLDDHQLMGNDNANVAGTWLLSNYVFERTGHPVAPFDLIHPAGQATILYHYDRFLDLPDSTGMAPGRVRGRGGATTTLSLTHNTLMTSGGTESGVADAGALLTGEGYVGRAGFVSQLADNLGWERAIWTGSQPSGFLAAYSLQASPQTPDNLVASGVTNNAHYNASTGTLYDQNGANGTPALGYHNWRQTVKPTLAADIDLGAGTNERTQGPRFADTTRNAATFDSSYLGNTAPAWQDAHAYSVGDIVSASSSTFYTGATINYRCIRAHTSAVADGTDGKPGSAVTISTAAPLSGYRVNWEFESVDRIRAATISGAMITDGAIGCASCTYIQALEHWVQAGYRPGNPILWKAASDGSTIGAVDMSQLGPAMLGAIQ